MDHYSFAEGHYYQPLMDYVDTILSRTYEKGKGYSEKYKSKTPEQYQLGLDLLQIAANHNYIPAVKELLGIEYRNGEIKKNNPLFLKGKKLGSFKASSYRINMLEEKDSEYNYEDYYFDAVLYKLLTSEDKYIKRMKRNNILPNESQIKIINQQAEELFNQMTPMVYIDGFTNFNDWKE